MSYFLDIYILMSLKDNPNAPFNDEVDELIIAFAKRILERFEAKDAYPKPLSTDDDHVFDDVFDDVLNDDVLKKINVDDFTKEEESKKFVNKFLKTFPREKNGDEVDELIVAFAKRILERFEAKGAYPKPLSTGRGIKNKHKLAKRKKSKKKTAKKKQSKKNAVKKTHGKKK